MPSLGFLLDQRKRFSAALNRFDPLRDDLFLRVLDPISAVHRSRDHEGGLPLLRIFVAWCLVVLPEVAFSLVPSNTFGGNFFIEYGMLKDLLLWSQFLLFGFWLILIVWVRRLLGDLVNELERTGVSQLPTDLNSMTDWNSFGLRTLERISRLTPRRGILWCAGLLIVNLLQLPNALADGRQTWTTSPWQPGSPLALFHIGQEQINLAGVWHFGIFSALNGYLIVVILRLYIAFTYLTQQMARDPSLHIIASHPDKTGGLLPVGQTSLILSLFSFTAGFWMTGLTFFVYFFLKVRPGFMFYALWGIYLVLGPLLFFLPLLPLRRSMIRAKREYLEGAEQLYEQVEREHIAAIKTLVFDPSALQGHASLVALLAHGREMAVWPFDKTTFWRFAGMLISPLAPIFAERAWPLIEHTLSFLQRP